MQLNINELFLPNNFIKTPKTNIDAVNQEQNRLYNFKIDLSNISNNAKDTKAIFVRGDRNSSILKAEVVKNNKPFDLSGFTAMINITENGNEPETFACNIDSEVEGLITIEIPPRYVDEEGECLFELYLQKNNKIILSQKYSYTVIDSIGEGAIGTDPQMTLLQSLIQQVQESKSSVDSIVDELEVTQSDIEDILNMVGGINE